MNWFVNWIKHRLYVRQQRKSVRAEIDRLKAERFLDEGQKARLQDLYDKLWSVK